MAPGAQGQGFVAHPGEQRCYVDQNLVAQAAAALQRRQREQVLHQPLHAQCVLAHHLQIALPPPLVQFDVAVGERLQKSGHHGKRAFQLMRDIGDEIAPHGFDFLGQRDIAREQQSLLLAVGNDGQRQYQPLAARQAQRQRLGIFALFEVGGKIRVPHQVDQGLPQIALLVQPQIRAGDRVAPLDVAMRVEQNDAVGQGQPGIAKAREVAASCCSCLMRARTKR